MIHLQRDISSPSAFILLDIDNFIPRTIDTISPEKLQSILTDSIRTVLLENIHLEEIVIRIYGGWLTDGNYTNRASALQQKMAQIRLFPYINERIRIRGRLELALSLIDLPTIIWENTLTEKDGIPRMILQKDKMSETCHSNSQHCPGRIIEKFTKKQSRTCQNLSCSIAHKDLFKSYGQKMVDNMIACDYLSLCNKDAIKIIYLISDDVDHFPSSVLGAINNNHTRSIVLGFTNDQYYQKWGHILNQFQSIKINLIHL